MIYEHYFALKQRPFSIAPNPSFLYACGQYQEALAALEYGMLHRGGFVLLTGEVGTGKTTLCKYLLQEVPQDTELALILHPQLDRLELLQLICKEFGIPSESDVKESQLIEYLTEFLLQVYSKGGYSVLIIDEAQHLDESVLELVRLLTNLETHEDKLLQIILLGQPELRERLNRYELRQLNQRFTARFHLHGLSFMQTQSYIQYRIEVAGGKQSLFSMPAIWMLHKLTKGIPRLVNVLADRCLMGCYAEQKKQVTLPMVWKASKEVISHKPEKLKIATLPKMAFLSLMIIAVAYGYNQHNFLSDFLNDKSNDVVHNLVNPVIPSTGKNAINPCGNESDCWFGQLPLSILNESSMQGQVWINGIWQEYQRPLSSVKGPLSVAVRKVPYELQNSLIKPSERHVLIPWVREVLQVTASTHTQGDTSGWQLITPENKPVESSDVYDVLLHETVKRFQQKHGLMVDGILGPQTLVSLSLLDKRMEMVGQ
ncbi:hypothetical protein NBRC116188_00740 [Oceaniserpentilla sp. 4NH20-0058]|uniref:ExeA family protein n=1 Tax=Oceaniserpentilla sp. 4NH20-0058 TaxID=3127660 RepID=UPI003103FE28